MIIVLIIVESPPIRHSGETVLHEPGAQMEFTSEGCKSMVRQKNEGAPGIHPVHRLFEHAVHLSVEHVYRIPHLRFGTGIVQRMPWIHRPKHHMRILIDTREIEKEQTFVEAVKFMIEGVQAFFENDF